MQLQGTRQLAAPPDTVWAAINDLDVLRRSLPGCERLERLADDRIAATVTARIGPMAATFAGTLRLHDIEAPHGCRIEGEGESATAGFARGRATIRLAPDSAGTRLDYEVEASVGGKLAQLGARLVQGAARKTADAFFSRFAELVEQSAAGTAAAGTATPATTAEPPRRPALPPAVWAPGMIALVIGLLLLVARL